jgi:hypothetical protein
MVKEHIPSAVPDPAEQFKNFGMRKYPLPSHNKTSAKVINLGINVFDEKGTYYILSTTRTWITLRSKRNQSEVIFKVENIFIRFDLDNAFSNTESFVISDKSVKFIFNAEKKA